MIFHLTRHLQIGKSPIRKQALLVLSYLHSRFRSKINRMLNWRNIALLLKSNCNSYKNSRLSRHVMRNWLDTCTHCWWNRRLVYVSRRARPRWSLSRKKINPSLMRHLRMRLIKLFWKRTSKMSTGRSLIGKRSLRVRNASSSRSWRVAKFTRKVALLRSLADHINISSRRD